MLSLPLYSAPAYSSSAYAPLYIAFPTTELHDTWLALLRSYAHPEVLRNGILHNMDVAVEATRDLYRVWRGVELEVVEGKGLYGGGGGGTSPVAPHGHFPRSNLTDEFTGSKEPSYDYDVFCEIFIDNVLAGRTTAKAAATTLKYQSSSSSPFDTAVVWHERFQWPDLPQHHILRVNVWKIRSEREKHTATTSSSGKDRLKTVSSSISGSVALISGTGGVNKKEREPILIGKIDIVLPNFRKGEWVEGWWGAAGPATLPFGDWGHQTPEIKLKIKVEE